MRDYWSKILPNKSLDVLTPECDKLAALQPQRKALIEFLEWLLSGEFNADIGPIHLAYYPFIVERRLWNDLAGYTYEEIPRDQWERSGQLESVTYQVDPLIFAFLGIDARKLEAERSALLEAQRKQNGC